VFGDDVMTTARYNILLVENSEAQRDRVQDALARNTTFRVVSHVRDALEAVAYMRRPRTTSEPEQSPMPDIVLLDLKALNCDQIEFLQWAQRRLIRPVLAVFSSENDPGGRKTAELLQADIYEPNIWEPNVLHRFLHFAGNMVDVKRREKPDPKGGAST
jgi:DNA-binding NarL/FixJ family response regulator